MLMTEYRAGSSPDNEMLHVAAIALRRSFIVESLERAKRSSAKLGFAKIDYGRLFIRDRWTLFAIARELNCTVEELISPVEDANDSRVVWSDLVAASESILAIVRGLNEPIRSLVLERASGDSWRKIKARRPERASWSIADDHARGVEIVLRQATREVRLIGFSDHPKFFVARRQK